jgi:hypothetical protein
LQNQADKIKIGEPFEVEKQIFIRLDKTVSPEEAILSVRFSYSI